MDGLDLLKAFREVAVRGSSTRAATSLGMSKASVSKYVAQLETRFGVRLLNRSTRSVSLTDAGHLLLGAQQAADGNGRAHPDRAAGPRWPPARPAAGDGAARAGAGARFRD